VSSQLQSLGLDAANAKDRVAALTDEKSVPEWTADRRCPAAVIGWVVAAVILIAVRFVYYLVPEDDRTGTSARQKTPASRGRFCLCAAAERAARSLFFPQVGVDCTRFAARGSFA
jgi:hypothetical protein